MNIAILKQELKQELDKKQHFINEIKKFVTLYDGKIVFDDIESEEPNVIIPIDYFFTDTDFFAPTDIEIYDDEAMLRGYFANINPDEEYLVPLDELSLDGLNELVYWLDLYDKEYNEKKLNELNKELKNLIDATKNLNTPFSNYLSQLDAIDFCHLLTIIGFEDDEERLGAIKHATPKACFAYTLYILELK